MEGAIIEGLTFDDVLLLPGQILDPAGRGRHAHLPDAQESR